jgi:serine/threonine protein kinase
LKDITRLLYQITTALKTLHDKNIIHRDLKLPNIFVTKDGNFKLGRVLFSGVIVTFFIIVFR